VPDKPETFKNIDYRTLDLNTDLTYREVPLQILEDAVLSPEEGRLNFVRFSGLITQRRKPLGNEKINFGKFPHTLQFIAIESRGRDSF
jgi:hypothetical protein